MARAALFQNKKFKLLCRVLEIPRPQAVGLLETMWHCCYETGRPRLANSEEVEAAAEWWGAEGKLTTALSNTRLIDPQEDGSFIIHDFWDHAPRNVQMKRKREDERKDKDLHQKPAHNGARRVQNGATPDTRHPTPDTRIKSAGADLPSPDPSKPKESAVKERKQPVGTHHELIRAFGDLWQTRYGKKYAFNQGKDGKHIKWVLETVQQDLAEATAVMQAYLADDDAWVIERRHSLGNLVSNFNKYHVRELPPRKVENGNGNAAADPFAIPAARKAAHPENGPGVHGGVD